jgi:hypothetical protein
MYPLGSSQLHLAINAVAISHCVNAGEFLVVKLQVRKSRGARLARSAGFVTPASLGLLVDPFLSRFRKSRCIRLFLDPVNLGTIRLVVKTDR